MKKLHLKRRCVPCYSEYLSECFLFLGENAATTQKILAFFDCFKKSPFFVFWYHISASLNVSRWRGGGLGTNLKKKNEKTPPKKEMCSVLQGVACHFRRGKFDMNRREQGRLHVGEHSLGLARHSTSKCPWNHALRYLRVNWQISLHSALFVDTL